MAWIDSTPSMNFEPAFTASARISSRLPASEKSTCETTNQLDDDDTFWKRPDQSEIHDSECGWITQQIRRSTQILFTPTELLSVTLIACTYAVDLWKRIIITILIVGYGSMMSATSREAHALPPNHRNAQL